MFLHLGILERSKRTSFTLIKLWLYRYQIQDKENYTFLASSLQSLHSAHTHAPADDKILRMFTIILSCCQMSTNKI